MRAQTLYDLLAPAYGRVLDSVLELATTRAVERVAGGWPASVLEVGLGPGRALAQLSARGRRLVGLDLSARMLGLARAHLAARRTTAALVRGDILSLPFVAGSFDTVLTMLVLDLLPDSQLPLALTELERLVAPGGRLVIGVMELPNPLIERAWMAVYETVPEVVGRCRPVRIEPYLAGRSFRVLREERVEGWITIRVMTLVRAVGP